MKEITTMEEALSLVPEYWPLVEGQKVLFETDEIFWGDTWLPVRLDSSFDRSIANYVNDRPWRRKIPQSVREAEARWILYSALAAVAPLAEWDKLPAQFILTVYGRADEGDVHLDIESEPQFNGLRSFDGQEAAYKAIKVLGGEQAVIQMLTEGPGALWRWVAEMRGNQ